MFSRSYNIGFHNLAPPFPRDLAFGLLISFVTLLAFRARSTTAWAEVAAGCCLGLVGLTGGETFIVGVGLALVVAVFDSEQKIASLARLLGPAVTLYGIWFVPIVIDYIELGGFVSITHIIPVTLPTTAIVVSWGLVTPFALYGAFRFVRKFPRDHSIRLCVLFTVTATAFLALAAVIPELLGQAFDTLGRKHRYWPILYLSLALIGALGMTELLTRLRARSRGFGIASVVALTAVAWASPVVASIALPTHIGRYPGIEDAMREKPGALLYELRKLGPSCNVAAPQEVAREVFSYTGFRLVLWTGNWFGDNRARIRWADIYETIGSEEQRIEDNKTLIAPGTDDTERRALASRYGVDVIVMQSPSGPLALPQEPADIEASYDGTDYLVMSLRPCDAGPEE